MRWFLWVGLLLASPSTARSPDTRDLVELVDLSGIAISPDGRSVAFREDLPSIARNDDDLGWYVVPIDDSVPPRRVGDGGTPIWNEGVAGTEVPQWSADSQWLYYRALINGEIQIWRSSRAGVIRQQLTHDPSNVEGFALDAPRHRLVYQVGPTRDAIRSAEDKEDDDGIYIDKSVDPAMGLAHNAILDGRLATQRVAGLWFHHGGLLSDAPRHARSVDLESLAVDDVDDAALKLTGSVPAPFTMLDGRYVSTQANARDRRGTAFVVSAGVTDEVVVKRAGAPGGKVACPGVVCRSGHIRNLVWQPGSDRLLFSIFDPGMSETLFLWDVAGKRIRKIGQIAGAFGGDRYAMLPCAIDEQYAVCVAAGADRPPRLERIALATGQRTVLAAPNAALDGGSRPLVEPMRWTDADGHRFTGQLFLPVHRVGERTPLFVTYYSCNGYLRGGLGDEFPLAPMAEHGIAALCINRAPVAPGFHDNVAQYDIALSGISSVVDLLDRRGLIDRRRIGMGGLSFGGEVTAWVALHSDLLAATSISSTLLEPAYWWFNGVAGRDTHAIVRSAWGLGAPDETPDRWKTLSPALRSQDFHAPLLMQMPDQEFRLNMELYARLSQSPTPVELFAFPDEAHIKFQPRHKLAVYDRNLDWFRYWLQGYVDPDPAKRDQYRRWQGYARKPAT